MLLPATVVVSVDVTTAVVPPTVVVSVLVMVPELQVATVVKVAVTVVSPPPVVTVFVWTLVTVAPAPDAVEIETEVTVAVIVEVPHDEVAPQLLSVIVLVVVGPAMVEVMTAVEHVLTGPTVPGQLLTVTVPDSPETVEVTVDVAH